MSPGLAACLPGQAFLLNDEIELFVADGGPHGLGFVRARKRVDPEEWFFKAHFYQDPVVPGSIGLEAFIQCLEVVALERWPHLAGSHRFVPTLLGEPHTWVYRGQVIPSNALVRVEAMVTALRDEPHPTVVADGFLHVDGLTIYEMRGFGIRMVPSEGARA
jgi:3-hydroxymyristoyl/3-hydroxydecanoyl-(acyl carrier protein) dehydratase